MVGREGLPGLRPRPAGSAVLMRRCSLGRRHRPRSNLRPSNERTERRFISLLLQ